MTKIVIGGLPPEGRARRRRQQKYGVTPAQYDQLFEDQDGACAICRRPETTEMHGRPIRLAIDHNHNTDVIRGLLCFRCNTALGMFDDNPAILRAALAYLEANP
jgi:hypothetical protein